MSTPTDAAPVAIVTSPSGEPTPVAIVTTPPSPPPDASMTPVAVTTLPPAPAVPTKMASTPLPDPTPQAVTIITTPATAAAQTVPPNIPAQQTQTTPSRPTRSSSRDQREYMLINLLIAIIFPPAAVFLLCGCGAELAFNIIIGFFTLWIGSLIHALYIVLREDEDYTSKRLERKSRRNALKERRMKEKADAKAASHAAKEAKKHKS